MRAFCGGLPRRLRLSLLRLLLLLGRLLRRLLLRRALARTHEAVDRRHQRRLGQMGVPDLHRGHLGELGHRRPVGAHRGECGVASVGLAEAVVARRDREARRHPLQVVLERAGQRLVEVVQVEQQLPLGGREHAEVRQMGVAAELNLQAGPGRVLQVGGHDLGRAAVEGERRDQHPPVAHRHQVGLTGRILLLEQRDRVGAISGRLPAGGG